MLWTTRCDKTEVECRAAEVALRNVLDIQAQVGASWAEVECRAAEVALRNLLNIQAQVGASYAE